MTQSGRFEIWFRGDGMRVRHKVGEHTSKHDADKQWKRLTFFAPPSEAAKYELLEPSVKQQLKLREDEIAGKGKQQPLERKSFERLLMEKIDAKRKQYAWLEKQEREKPHLNYGQDKLIIEGGIRALKWAHAAYLQSMQMEITVK